MDTHDLRKDDKSHRIHHKLLSRHSFATPFSPLSSYKARQGLYSFYSTEFKGGGAPRLLSFPTDLSEFMSAKERGLLYYQSQTFFFGLTTGPLCDKLEVKKGKTMAQPQITNNNVDFGKVHKNWINQYQIRKSTPKYYPESSIRLFYGLVIFVVVMFVFCLFI